MDHLREQTHKFLRSARQMTKVIFATVQHSHNSQGHWTDPSYKSGLEKKLDDAERTFGKVHKRKVVVTQRWCSWKHRLRSVKKIRLASHLSGRPQTGVFPFAPSSRTAQSIV